MPTSPLFATGLRTVIQWAACAAMVAVPMVSSAAVDADAAQALFKKNDCNKCHAVDREKKGPALKKIAEKLKAKPNGEELAIKNMTTAPKVKLSDGTEEEHKNINTKDMAAIKNLAQWIMSH